MRKRISLFLIILFGLTSIFTLTVFGNSSEPPSLTIIVSNAPEDLKISIKNNKGETQTPVVLIKSSKSWETYFRFFNHQTTENYRYSDKCVAVIEYNGESFECPIPRESLESYNNYMTLNLRTKTLKSGQNSFRVPALVLLRVILTIITEGIILLLFGYRKKTSFMVFLVTNLITQGFLNAMITGPLINGYWIIGFVFLEILILIFEIIVYFLLLKEHSRTRGLCFAVIANIASLIIGGAIITYIPI